MSEDTIILKNICVHNLQNVDLEIPKGGIVLFTGVSGSGKSSLLFDGLYAEGLRRYAESLSVHARRFLSLLPRAQIDAISGLAPVIAMAQEVGSHSHRSTVGTVTGIYDLLRVLFARIGTPYCPVSGEKLVAQTAEQILTEILKTFDGAKGIFLAPYKQNTKGLLLEVFGELVRQGFTRVRIDGEIKHIQEIGPLDPERPHTLEIVIDRVVINFKDRNRLAEAIKSALKWGQGRFSLYTTEGKEKLFSENYYSPQSHLSYPPLEPQDFSFFHRLSMCPECEGLGCEECGGSRLKPYPAHVRWKDRTIGELTQMFFPALHAWISQVTLSKREEKVAKDLLEEMHERLTFMIRVGLSHLSLDRSFRFLSRGEAQRVQMAAHVHMGLTGVIYILDEPSSGLHPSDCEKVIELLRALREKGNTLLVVDHDEVMIRAADWIIDLGPGAGPNGGKIVAEGTLQEICDTEESLTGGYLSGRLELERSKTARKRLEGEIELLGAYLHTLQHVDLRIPLGTFTCITGVSGSGKSSLIMDTLVPALQAKLRGIESSEGHYRDLLGWEAFQKVIAVDQSPLGHSSRSSAVTYLKIFDDIRALYAALPASRARKLTPSHFSWNHALGACPTCRGSGIVVNENLEETFACPDCEGKRFSRTVLAIQWKGHSIADLLDLTVDEAAALFRISRPLAKKLELLREVGLGYLQLGQSGSTLSGGEAQRVKLARELSKPPAGKVLYVLDEPTTGLHPHDTQALLRLIQEIVGQGHTVVCIEHNMDFIQRADWIIDLDRGRIVGENTPAKMAKLKTATGIALKDKDHFTIKKSKKRTVKKETKIEIRHANTLNLQNLSLSLPLHKTISFTGPAGSGKSALAVHTLYAEAQYRFLETLSPHTRQAMPMMPRPDASLEGLPLAIVIDRHAHPKSQFTLGTWMEVVQDFTILFALAGVAYQEGQEERILYRDEKEVAQQVFKKGGKGVVKILAPQEKREGEAWAQAVDQWNQEGFLQILIEDQWYALDEALPTISGEKVFLLVDQFSLTRENGSRLEEAILRAAATSAGGVVIERSDGKFLEFQIGVRVGKTKESFQKLTPADLSFASPQGMCLACRGSGKREEGICVSCEGTRLNEIARKVKLNGKTLPQVGAMKIRELLTWAQDLKVDVTLHNTQKKILANLKSLERIGLSYLSMDRSLSTLSGGELRRIALARQLALGLGASLYILEEPTAGVHPHECRYVLAALEELKKQNNTILLLSSEPQLLDASDQVFAFENGKIVQEEPIPFPLPKHRRQRKEKVEIAAGCFGEVGSIDCVIRKKTITVVTGLSGSGKTTLLRDILQVKAQGAFQKIVFLPDQDVAGRSDVSTYMELQVLIRAFFTLLPQAKAYGLTPAHFSTHRKEGVCEACEGKGVETVVLKFLPPVEKRCELCGGYGLNAQALGVQFKGHHFGEFLAMSAAGVFSYFSAMPWIAKKLQMLLDLGLGHLPLNQEIGKLSSMEAKRLILAKIFLQGAQDVLYLFDEPFAGMDPTDLLQVFPYMQMLVDQGATFVIAEHRLECLGMADYLIELEQGKVLNEGTPEEIRRIKKSYIGQYLAEFLGR